MNILFFGLYFVVLETTKIVFLFCFEKSSEEVLPCAGVDGLIIS